MKGLGTWCAWLLAALLSLAPLGATAAPQQSVRPDGDASFRVAAWNDRVCCKRGWQDWWTTRRACKRAGGYQTANRECRNDWNEQWDFRWWTWNGGDWNQRVCCKRGNRDWWTSALECRNSFGYQTANRECRNDAFDERVCCKRGWQDWWTTRGGCKRAGGYQTANRECRNDWNEQWDFRWWSWNGGDWNQRVCCKKGNRDWWTTALECRNAFGYQTTNKECRNDNWNEGGNWNGNNGNWNNDWDNRWRVWQGDWNSRVCCKKGYRDWWSSAFECRAAGGYQTMNKECRND